MHLDLQRLGRRLRGGRYDPPHGSARPLGVAFVGCAILGFVSAGITAIVVRFPNGGYDMKGMWTIAAARFAAWVISTSIVAALLVRARVAQKRRSATPPRVAGRRLQRRRHSSPALPRDP